MLKLTDFGESNVTNVMNAAEPSLGVDQNNLPFIDPTVNDIDPTVNDMLGEFS